MLLVEKILNVGLKMFFAGKKFLFKEMFLWGVV